MEGEKGIAIDLRETEFYEEEKQVEPPMHQAVVIFPEQFRSPREQWALKLIEKF